MATSRSNGNRKKVSTRIRSLSTKSVPSGKAKGVTGGQGLTSRFNGIQTNRVRLAGSGDDAPTE